jgi:RNA polymerase sigma-70 factor (ECF subfamily)
MPRAVSRLPSDDVTPITQLLQQWRDGDAAALDVLTPLVYGELRRVAGAYLRRERAGHGLQPTDLVHEAFVRLIRQATPDYQNRAHFLAIAAEHMRQILIDHARRRLRHKRGGGAVAVTLDANDFPVEPTPIDVLDLDAALVTLASFDHRKSRILEMHFFGGLSYDDIATVLGLHVNTVSRDLRLARAWLLARLRPDPPSQEQRQASSEQNDG